MSSPSTSATDNNPLITIQGSSELQVILHPLVLLTISDYITRHTLRKQTQPIVGALLGQQNGREISIEHAFECEMGLEEQGAGEPLLHRHHFHERLEQMKKVHQDRQLDFVGWYTLLPSLGPSATILPIHRIFLHEYNESAILLGFHPDQAANQSTGGKLPLTIYESIMEIEATSKPDHDTEDKNMDDSDGRPQLKFRELSYSVETDETEMISMNYVAGGGSATLSLAKDDKLSRAVESNGKGKRRLVESEADQTQAFQDGLTPEEDEMIASLTTKANAVKMLQSRIGLIATYLENLPPSLASGSKSEDVAMDTDSTVPSLTVLRQIQALISRLDLIIPSDKAAFDRELLQEANNANMIVLLNQVVESTSQAREVGKKFNLIEAGKIVNQRRTPVDYQAQSALSSLGAGDIII